MSSFTYTQQKEFVGASKTDTEDECKYTCIHPHCGMTISSVLTDRCPGCGDNPFKLGEHEVFTVEQLAIQRAVKIKKEELSH